MKKENNKSLWCKLGLHDEKMIDHDNGGCIYECKKCGNTRLYRG